MTVPPEEKSGETDFFLRLPSVLRDRQLSGFYRFMEKNRLEVFSDGVIAIIITIMVLELRPPPAVELADLKPMLPMFLSYVLSFIYVGIYWNNHHHMFHSTEKVTGGILWANLHLLFWLSLFHFTTAWVGENHLAPTPVAVYGFVLLRRPLHISFCSVPSSGNKAAIPLAFVSPWIASGLYVFVALMWLVPDRRIERVLTNHEDK